MEDENIFIRAERLLGAEKLTRLKKARVAVFGVGGVGSYVAEALARSGVGSVTLIDHDTVSPSNINRQLHALPSTLGRFKAEVPGIMAALYLGKAIASPLIGIILEVTGSLVLGFVAVGILAAISLALLLAGMILSPMEKAKRKAKS